MKCHKQRHHCNFQFTFLMVGLEKNISTMNLDVKIFLIHEGSQRLQLGFAPKGVLSGLRGEP